MRIVLITLVAALLSIAPATGAQFDIRGVWHPVTATTLAKSQSVSFGIIDVSDMDNIFTVLISGTGDSLVTTLTVLGMMSANIADTSKSVTVYSSTQNKDALATAYSDTLEGTTRFPYLYCKVTNSDADSSLTGVDVWVYMQPRELNFSGGTK